MRKTYGKPILTRSLYAHIWLPRGEGSAKKFDEFAIAKGYREQTKRHITVLGTGWNKMRSKILSLSEVERNKIVFAIRKLINKHDWKYSNKNYYHIERSKILEYDRKVIEKRKAYIMAIDMPDMGRFFKELSTMLNSRIPTQFPHITLFTAGERPKPIFYGIPIASKAAFKGMRPRLIKMT